MSPTIHLAYDASINAEWVARYAIRLASRTPDRILRLINVDDGSTRPPDFDQRLARIERASGELDTRLESALVPVRGDVADTLLSQVAPGRDSILLCATRTRDAGRGLLGGTVSARLLQRQHCGVLAIHVVSPGLLGRPRRILYALSSNPNSVRRALPFLRLLSVGVDELTLLTVMEVRPIRFANVTNASRNQLLDEGRARLRRVADEITTGLDGPVPRIDSHVVVSDDVPGQIVAHAARTRADLVLVGATERSLPRRVVFGSPLESVLAAAPCDVAIFREASGA